jgi:two-component system, sensor histidine kinase PdtaS
MMPTEERPFASRLAVRFAIIIAIALLPAGIISFIQTSALEREVQARSEAALLGASLRSAAAETGVIRRARGMAAALAAALPEVIADPARCDALMQAVAKQQPTASIIAYVPPSGFMTCSSVDRDYDYSGEPALGRLLAAREPVFFVNARGPVSGTSILGIVHPVLGRDGAYLGYATIALPHSALSTLRDQSADANEIFAVQNDLVFWTFDREGTLLSSNIDLIAVEQKLPADQPLQEYVGRGDRVFQAMSRSGQIMTYAIVPIVNDELYIMSTLATERVGFLSVLGVGPYLPTMLMWLAGLAAAGFAAELLVTRHVRALNHAMVGFARGDRRLQVLDMKNAPAELDELGSAYLAMTDNITRGEAELEDSVHQKEVLLREVHHRVKNNLQLISSIMNIQIRNAKGGEAKELVKNLQERIMSLATVHRGLYQTSGLADVKARELFPDIVRQIMSLSSNPDRPFETSVEIDDLRLVPDQAVPLSLLLAEAMTNAIKHAGAARDRPAHLTVRLKRSGGSDAVLEVVNSRNSASPDQVDNVTVDTGLGTQLIVAFVQQLGGKQTATLKDDAYALKVTFRLSPLAQAEERQISLTHAE